MVKRLFLSLGFLWGTAVAADAFCSEPYDSLTVPDAPGSYERPNVPYWGRLGYTQTQVEIWDDTRQAAKLMPTDVILHAAFAQVVEYQLRRHP